MLCKYCTFINSSNAQYSISEGTRDLDSDFPRCDLHWRYVCDLCQKPRHFNGITWCEESRKFICLRCGEDHRLVEEKFFGWNSYYAIRCPFCHEWHPTLDRLEYQGEHPWQLHTKMLHEKAGLSPEKSYADPVISHYFPPDHVISDKTIGEAWDAAAHLWWGGYNEFGDTNRRYIIDPTILRIFGDVEGKQILDAGCGNGYLSRILSKKGSIVEGVDVSEEAIRMARAAESEMPLGIRYHVGSLSDLSMFKNDKFDLVVSNIVLCDLPDLNRVFAELRRVVKPNGKLVFSILHPCFSSPPVRGWVRKPIDSDRAEDWLYWKTDRYFERGVEEWQLGELPPLYGFHRTLSDYIQSLLKNGFTITEFEEPVPQRKYVKEHHRQLNDGERIPWFLVIGALKASHG